MSEHRIFECTRCGHVAFVYEEVIRCRACGSKTGVIKTVDSETAQRMRTQPPPTKDKGSK